MSTGIMAAKKACCVKDCLAGNAEDVTFFSLPLNDERRLQWLKLIGRTDLHNDQHDPKDYVVCSTHFEKTKIKVLKHAHQKAIPTRNIPSIRKGQSIISSHTGSQTDFSSSDDDNDHDEDELDSDDIKVIIYKRIKPNRKMFVHCEIECDDMQMYDDVDDVVDEEPSFKLCYSENKPRDSIDLGNRKIFAFCEDENVEIRKNDKIDITEETTRRNVENNNEANNIVPIITNVISLQNPIFNFNKFFEWRQRTIDRRKGAKYERDFKIFALNLHTINTRAYRLLMDSWQLPKENELKNVKLRLGPIFDEQMVRLLEQKFKSLSNKEKCCTLGLYVMPLKPHFYYDPANDDIIGVHNVNGDKKRTAAIYVLIAMVRGIIVPWHQPVAYSFFSTMTDVDNIDRFVNNTIVKLKNMGLKILGVVMGVDQFFWKFCRTKHFFSMTKLYIRSGADKMYIVFDLPHVLNMFKNEFMENDYVFENENVSGKYVKQVYAVDKQNGGRLLPKLTVKHVKVDSKETSPENICQVFSKAVCGAIYFYKDHGLMDVESTPTGYFIKKVNEIFDVLMDINKDINNDSVMKLVTAQNKALDNGFSLFKKLKIILNSSTNVDADSLKYILFSLKSLWNISLALKNAQQIGIAHSRFCSLEPMLEYIKSIRNDTKTNKPSPIKFMQSFSKLFLKNLIKLTPAPSSIGNMDDFLKMADGVKDFYEIYSQHRIYLKDHDYRFSLPDQYAIIYVSSFLLYKCSELHTCNTFVDFMKRLVDLNKTKVYVHFENHNKEAAFYDKLKLPPIELPAYVERLDNYFLTCFNDFYQKTPAEAILRALKNVPPWKFPCPCFPNEYMLKLFVRTRIYETVLHNSKCLKNLSVITPYTMEAKKL